jgi:hypothetical protein
MSPPVPLILPPLCLLQLPLNFNPLLLLLHPQFLHLQPRFLQFPCNNRLHQVKSEFVLRRQKPQFRIVLSPTNTRLPLPTPISV